MFTTLAMIFTIIVILIHAYIVWMEMFAWETAGKKAFGKALPDALFKPTKTLAANQGLYNGFLVAGLVWSFIIGDPIWSVHVRTFFLSLVIVAGMYGTLTASKKIFFIQALPAILALFFTILN